MKRNEINFDKESCDGIIPIKGLILQAAAVSVEFLMDLPWVDGA